MKRSAFTLVELLVVTVIIALLAAILITAVGAAREAARRGQCVSRQRDLAHAMIAYSTANNGLPGYLNQLGATPIHSWAVAVMPNIGETKRYEALMRGEQTAQATASLPALICPSDNPRENSRLNYVVNCGPSAGTQNITGEIALYFTLFKDRRSNLITPSNIISKKVPIEEIPDGVSNTILLSENVNAGVWYHEEWNVFALRNQLPVSDNQLPVSYKDTRSLVAVENLGFVWELRSDFLPNSPAVVPRPSSKHPGTVVVAYADGKAEAINDDIAANVWVRLVCPDDAQARLSVVPDEGLGFTEL